MENLPRRGSSSFDSISRELVRLRTVAATALKSIDTLYQDVMGCQTDGEPEELSEDITHNSDASNLDAESCNDFFSGASTQLPDMAPMHGNRCNLHRIRDFYVDHNHCHRCHRVIDPYAQIYRHSYNPLYSSEGVGVGQCNSCGRLMNSHPNVAQPRPIIRGPITVRVSGGGDDDVGINQDEGGKHECPLKATVPEPFKMTIREEGKKEMKELKRKELKKKLNEAVEKELRKKIHSNPVPGNTYVPMYQKMIETNEERRKKRKEVAVKRIKESVKPFNFHTPRQISFRRSGSVPHLNVKQEEKPVMFKAQPLPKRILSNEVDERLKNSEIVRKHRIHQRAEELLQKSSLPFTSKSCLRRSTSAMNLKEKSKIGSESVKYNVHQKYQKVVTSHEENTEIMKTWNTKVSEFHATCRTSNVDKIAVQRKPKSAPEKSPLYDVPVRKTAASMKREELVRNEISGKQERGKNAYWQNNYEKKKLDLKGTLSNRLKMTSLSPKAQRGLEKKLQEFRISRRNRQQEYEKELEEMRKRIANMPLLIERQANKFKSDEGHKSDRSARNTPTESSQSGDSQTESRGEDNTSDDQEDLPESSA